jgi:hypothetical protein
MAKETGFRRWRRQMGFTQVEATAALDCSLSQVKNWDAGVDRGLATRSVPSLIVRYVMQEMAKGTELKPWPE